MLKDDFHTLDTDYRLNLGDSDAVRALNDLGDVDRNLFISYIEANGHYSTLARKVKLSVPFLKVRIDEIKEEIKKKIKQYELD